MFRIAEIESPLEPSLESYIDMFAPQARPVMAATVQMAVDHGTAYDLELPLITARGRPKWVRTQGFSEFQDSKVIRLYGTFQDITERKNADGKAKQGNTADDAGVGGV